MVSFRQAMEKIEVNSPKDCIWYVLETSRCKIPGFNGVDSICVCTDGAMQEFCMWVTKFLKSSSDVDQKELAGIKLPDDFCAPDLDNLSHDDMTQLQIEIEALLAAEK